MNVTKKHARAVIPGDRLVFRNRSADRVWHERVIGVRHAPICQGVIIKTRRDGETIGELRLNPHDEVEVAEAVDNRSLSHQWEPPERADWSDARSAWPIFVSETVTKDKGVDQDP